MPVLALSVAMPSPGWCQPSETPSAAQGPVDPEVPAPAAAEAGDAPETDEFRQTGEFPEERSDADADGVADIDDNCPATPAEQPTPAGILRVQVDECGCPRDPCTLDGDGDGVPDCRDFCPDTPPGALVGTDGCTLPLAETRSEELDVRFEFEKHDVRPEFEPVLVKIRDLLLSAPNLQVTFEGHADWKGPQSFNQPLSERRAQACRDFVLHGTTIAPERIKAVGFGELRPIADNRTDEGRARNRRVTSIISDLRDRPPEAVGEPPAADPPSSTETIDR